MLVRHGVARGASFRNVGCSIPAGIRSSSCGQRDRQADGNLILTAPRARPPRRRPLSTDATPSPPPRNARELELEFPPPPPPKRGPISAASGPALSGDDGSSNGGGGRCEPATAAAAAPGVTVNTSVSGDDDEGGDDDTPPVQEAPLFRRPGDNVERVGGDDGDRGDGGGDSGGVGRSSWDDAWGMKGGGEAGTPVGAHVGAAARLSGSRDGGGGAGASGGGGRGVEQMGETGPDTEVKASRLGDERAHKMWVTGGGAGDGVSEHEWHAEWSSGSGKEDTAVIQFHSQREIDHRRFQGLGVVKEDKAEDIRTLVDSFTAPALAAALRDRETALHACAHLFEQGDLSGVKKTLLPFTARQVAKSRRELKRLDLDPEGFTTVHMYTLKKVLQRLPRHVTTLTEQRASVMIPLCNVDGVASVLFTKRSSNLRAHKNEVCFPGGKVDIGQDQHIIQTALREMGEEIGIQESSVDVLGVLRCDWAELASLIGVAVTPVVGFLGNLSREQIHPNPDEVSHCFTIPMRYLLQQDRWKMEKYKAPAFVGGPYQIWGLTGYILHRLVNDVIRQRLIVK